MGGGTGEAESNQLPPKLEREDKKGKGHAFGTKSGSQARLHIGQPQDGKSVRELLGVRQKQELSSERAPIPKTPLHF